MSVLAQTVVRIGTRNPKLGKDSYGLNCKVLDDFTGLQIDNATLYLMTKDSVVVDSAQTKKGRCTFMVNRDKSFRSCIIKVTHPGYQTLYSAYSLRYVGKQTFFDLPDMYMKKKSTFTDQVLDEVVVTATKVQLFYRGDTLVYNADAFNVADGSMLDALIKQMPGTELNKQGEIFVNGRKVENLLLNGKDFFRGKNKLMLENLPYYTVKEIKVYDQTTDKAMVLQDDRAKKDFVMDVSLKKEYSKGYMANVGLGAGTEDAYLARLFGLRFTDVSRWAVVGGMNNLNMSDYSFSGSANDNGLRDGRTVSNLLTAELMTEHKRQKNVLTVELNRKKTKRGADEIQETFHNEGSTFSTLQNSQVNRNLGVSLTNKYTLKVPFWLESTTQLRFNSKKDDSDERYYESGADTRAQGVAVLDSLFSMGVALNDPSMISARKRWVKGRVKEYEVSQDFNSSKRMYSSDIIDIRTGIDYSESTNEKDRFNRYSMWMPVLTQDDIVENIASPNTHVGVKAGLSYRISRLLYETDLNFFANYSFCREKDRETIVDVTSMEPDAVNSYNRRMTECKYTVGMNYNYEHLVDAKKLRTAIEVRLPLSIINRSTNYSRYTVDTCLKQSPVFFEPSLTFTYMKWKGNNYYSADWGVTVSTSLKYSLPDATQLITLSLTSDRINIYQGNAHLKSPMIWKSSLTWDWPMKKRTNYIRHELVYCCYPNRIVNTYRYDSGIYIHQPENVNDTWDIEFNTRGRESFGIGGKKVTFSWRVNSSYHRMRNFIADGAAGMSQSINNDELCLRVPIQFVGGINKLTYALSSSVEWHNPMGDRSNIYYQDALRYTCGLWASIPIIASIDLESNCEFSKRQGYASEELNKLSCEWDMSLSKSVLKNKIGLKLQAIDILHQYKSVAYVINERGIRETHAIALPSYWLFTVTYKFNKQPAKK